MNKVFLSYRWCDSEIANNVTNCLKGVDINIIRDLNELDYLDVISSFMNTSARSRQFVAIMTESYFYSRYCMYEFCQIAESKQLIRTVPILLGTAEEPGIEEKLQAYWRVKYEDLNEVIRGIDGVYINYLQPELNFLASIPTQAIKLFSELESPVEIAIALDLPFGPRKVANASLQTIILVILRSAIILHILM